MSATGADSTGADKNPPTEEPHVSTVVQVTTAAPSVPANIFTGTLQVILGFTITQGRGFFNDGYDSQESVMYCKLTDIKDWFHLKSRIPANCGGVSYVDMKMKCLQVLYW